MFKVEGLKLPANIQVDDSKRKKKADANKLSGDELQGMLTELSSGNTTTTKPDAGKKGRKSNTKEVEQPLLASNKPSHKREAMLKTQSTTPAAKRTKKDATISQMPLEEHDNYTKSDRRARINSRPDVVEKTNPNLPKPKPESTALLKRSKKQLTPLQLKMQQKLSGSRFRWINEQLYTTNSDHAFQIFQEQPQVFQEYHDGFRHQVESWPENPVLSFVQQFKDRLSKPVNAPGGLPGDKKTGEIIVADMGCGEAELSLELSKLHQRKAKFHVHSFDLYAANERISAADIAHVPLPDDSCHVVVFCLALMGTNLADFVAEGIRILKPGGLIWIAEIKSRFSGYDVFIDTLKQMGLYHRTTDESNKMFVKFEFAKLPHKMAQASVSRPDLVLKPCIYKRR